MPARPNAEELEEFLTRAVAEVIVRDELAALLKETQALPQARIVSEKEIETEIAAYRAAGA